MNDNRLGHLCYYDSFRGLVKCTAIKLDGHKITLRVNAEHFPYKRGELIETVTTWAIPRKCVYTRSGMYRINSYYSWVNLDTGLTAIATR